MDNTEQNFEEWDNIFAQREVYIKEHPEEKNMLRPKTFKDEEGVVRCTKCGGVENFSTCPECVEEKKFLRQKG